jgi:hypothetical protein
MSVPGIIITVDVFLPREEYEALIGYFSIYGIKLMAHDSAEKKLLSEAHRILNAPKIDQEIEG